MKTNHSNKTTLAVVTTMSAAATISCAVQENKSTDPLNKSAENPAALQTPAPGGNRVASASPTPSPAAAENKKAYDGFLVTGSLNLQLGLLASTTITHVVAFNPESGRSIAVPVDPTSGEFTLPLAQQGKIPYVKADGTVDREKFLADNQGKVTKEELDAYSDEVLIPMLKKDAGFDDGSEATPWIISYVDANKTGAEMVVSRFKANTLDSIAPAPDSNTVLDLGEIEPIASGAETQASYEDILKATNMSAATANAFGATDDVSLRYINPDIDNDGKLDMPVFGADGELSGQQKKFILDFHNRFQWVDQNNAQIQMTSLKNKFPEDVVGGLQNLKVRFTGSGIVPEMEKSWFSTVPSSYKWKFDQSITLSSNGSYGCSEDSNATVIPANQWCTSNFTPDAQYGRYQFFREVATPPEGTYTLEVGGKTFTWTNVTVSDFSAGEGFLALMLKYPLSAG